MPMHTPLGIISKVFGVGGVTRHPQCRRVQLAQLGHDVALEACAIVVVMLLVRAHAWLR
jgi:hypothetical protein